MTKLLRVGYVPLTDAALLHVALKPDRRRSTVPGIQKTGVFAGRYSLLPCGPEAGRSWMRALHNMGAARTEFWQTAARLSPSWRHRRAGTGKRAGIAARQTWHAACFRAGRIDFLRSIPGPTKSPGNPATPLTGRPTRGGVRQRLFSHPLIRGCGVTEFALERQILDRLDGTGTPVAAGFDLPERANERTSRRRRKWHGLHTLRR